MDLGGNIGSAWTRVLHYHYNCDRRFQDCKDEEQFYLANGCGIWQWKYYRNGELLKTALMNNLVTGKSKMALLCVEAYR